MAKESNDIKNNNSVIKATGNVEGKEWHPDVSDHVTDTYSQKNSYGDFPNLECLVSHYWPLYFTCYFEAIGHEIFIFVISGSKYVIES